MTSTNQAFIDAYRSGARNQRVSPIRTGEDAQTFFAGGEIVAATVSSTVDLEQAEVAPPHSVSTDEAPSIDRDRRTARRPLSQVQAENLFELPQPDSAAFDPTWPEQCQELLAKAADRYDTVLRKLPSQATGTLVGIVGTGGQTGCTTTAICLALRSSALGHRVALVDGNLSHGGLAAALEVDSYASWARVLASNAPIATAIQSAEDVGVDLLLTEPIGTPTLEATARFRASLAAGVLRRNYERVIVDLGSPTASKVNLVADLTAAMGIDFLIATATPNTTDNDLKATAAALSEFGLNLAGVIEAA